jgi:hypothetical protein
MEKKSQFKQHLLLHLGFDQKADGFRATSHTILRACNHYTSSTLVGGKGEADPSLLYTTLDGPPEYVNARWM